MWKQKLWYNLLLIIINENMSHIDLQNPKRDYISAWLRPALLGTQSCSSGHVPIPSHNLKDHHHQCVHLEYWPHTLGWSGTWARNLSSDSLKMSKESLLSLRCLDMQLKTNRPSLLRDYSLIDLTERREPLALGTSMKQPLDMRPVSQATSRSNFGTKPLNTFHT